jgi:malate dehydrogenase (oxaloacetate-decarboxylating)(NADP+)
MLDVEAYRRSLESRVYTSGTVMQPVFAAATEAAPSSCRR